MIWCFQQLGCLYILCRFFQKLEFLNTLFGMRDTCCNCILLFVCVLVATLNPPPFVSHLFQSHRFNPSVASFARTCAFVLSFLRFVLWNSSRTNHNEFVDMSSIAISQVLKFWNLKRRPAQTQISCGTSSISTPPRLFLPKIPLWPKIYFPALSLPKNYPGLIVSVYNNEVFAPASILSTARHFFFFLKNFHTRNIESHYEPLKMISISIYHGYVTSTRCWRDSPCGTSTRIGLGPGTRWLLSTCWWFGTF